MLAGAASHPVSSSAAPAIANLYIGKAPRRADHIAAHRGPPVSRLPVFPSSYLVLAGAFISIFETVMLSPFISPVSAIAWPPCAFSPAKSWFAI